MQNKYLLYIDILGFSHLVRADETRVDTLYEIIDSLNVHRHHAFKTLVFSDTILVYNTIEPQSKHDHQYLVMYACEFAQNLLYETIGLDYHFRAILTYGKFQHYQLEHIDAFYGKGLISAYTIEKKIFCTGLFIDKKSNSYNNIFSVSRYDDNLSFVYLNQTLDRLLLDHEAGPLPVKGDLLADMDMHWHLAKDVRMLQDVHNLMRTHKDPLVRAKFLAAWDFFYQRYPKFINLMVKKNFDLGIIAPDLDWSEANARIGNLRY
ncbi:hypothetical protein ES705_15053 [subsurface metagenome]